MALTKDMASKKPMVRVFAVGKLNKEIKTYKDDEPLNDLDFRLLRGMYTADKKKLDAPLKPPESSNGPATVIERLESMADFQG